MEQHQNPRPRRRTTTKRKGSNKSLWQQLKSLWQQWPLTSNIVAYVLLFFGILVICYVAMNLFTRHGERLTVPDYLGENVRVAAPDAKTHELEIIISDSLYIPGYEGGIIVDQIPRGGAEVKSGRKVYVTINSFTQKMVRVPYVAGRSLRQAKNMLDIAGLGIEKLIYEPDLATNYVLAEVVNGITMKNTTEIDIPVGAGVVLKVGVNSESNTTIVPKTIGCSLREARSRLWEQGLNVGKVVFDDGINKLSELIDLAVKLDLVQKSGSWFSMGEVRLGQGKDAAKEYFRQNPEDADLLEKNVRENFHKLMGAQSRIAAKAAGRAVDVSADDFDDE